MTTDQSRTQRRLAAILAADVVGFSTLMGKDEEGTLARIKSLRRKLIEPKINEHHGRIFKTTGDGFLAEFSSPVEAVRCAVGVQEALASGATQEGSERLQLRMGINLGDIIVEEDGDVYGDGVNVAVRLEQLAEPGAVCVSGKIYEEVRDKLPYTFEDRGEQQVKNIARPIRTYSYVGGRQQLLGQAAVPLQSVSDRPSIAILAFKNNSGDPEQSYFSDGLTEDVITELSRFRELMVISQHSSFSFRAQSLDVREIGRLLGSEYMVEGSVRRAGDRLRITAQLLHCASGANLWGERYDRAVDDVFAIQEEIAQSIVSTVAQRVVRDSELAARRRVPENIRAYDLFLQGNHLTDAFAPEAQARAEALFEQALQIDPGFARAHTGLAWIYRNRSEEFAVGVPRAKDENKVKALHEAEQALALDPNDARVHFTQGYMNLMWRDFVGAERHIDLARRMNPNDATIQLFWAWVQSCLGHPERSLPAAEIALRLNPCHPTWYNFILAQVLFSVGRYEEAAAHLARLTSATPARHSRNMAWRAAAYGHSGDLPGAARCAGIFVDGSRGVWRGDASAGPREYVDWLVRRCSPEKRRR